MYQKKRFVQPIPTLLQLSPTECNYLYYDPTQPTPHTGGWKLQGNSLTERAESLATQLSQSPLLVDSASEITLLAETDRVALFPTSCFTPAAVESNATTTLGTLPPDAERLYTSSLREIVALCTLPHPFMEVLRHFWPLIHIEHPLRLSAARTVKTPTLEAICMDHYVHLTLHTPQLCFAETLRCSGSTDLLYYLSVLTAPLESSSLSILLSGTQALDYYDLVASYFHACRLLTPESERPTRKLRDPERQLFPYIHLIRCIHENY
ncbi:MAG: DUF3822 family protein [Alistipes sp.]|nr:DUF3822 family protein [Alistipes sp.]